MSMNVYYCCIPNDIKSAVSSICSLAMKTVSIVELLECHFCIVCHKSTYVLISSIIRYCLCSMP